MQAAARNGRRFCIERAPLRGFACSLRLSPTICAMRPAEPALGDAMTCARGDWPRACRWDGAVIFGVDVASMLLGGVAAGMVLFIVSVGLSVTMGLMGFVNLAHGAFAMLGGYVIVLAMRHWGIGFMPALALGFVVTAAVSVVLERLLYARLYRAGELDQVLFTIGLVFIMIAGGDAAGRAGEPAAAAARRRCRARSISASCSTAPTASS